MSPKDCAYIVERLAIRFMAMVADHERQLAEHRTSFGARTEADAKIIAGLRAEIKQRAKEQDQDHKTIVSLISERDGLRVQVQDMREEIIRVNEAHGRTKVENDGLLDELAAQRDAFTAEVAALKSQTPKHPVKVGEWVRRSNRPGAQSPVGIVKQVTSIRCYGYSYGFADRDCWCSDNCEPCAHQHPAQDGQWVRRTVASGTEPVGTMIQVQRSRTLHSEYVTRGAQVVPWAHCEPCDSPEATHDTEAGKASAEAALKTEPVADEIKVGDAVKVCSASGDNTVDSDIGRIGEVLEICSEDGTVLLSGGAGWVSLCDVRKVTT